MRLSAFCLLPLAGCGRYADFALPAPAGPAPEVRPRFTVRPAPVLDLGTDWEAVDVLNPSVVAFGGRLLNVYSGYDGKTWHTGVAESRDGVAWERHGRVLSPDASWEGRYIAANGAALARGHELLYWYQAGSPPRIGLARSRDGRAWTKHPDPVLSPGPLGSWDERGVADPYVIEAADGLLYMFFLGQNRARQQRLGIARSRDGITWTKLRMNPILEIGEEGAFDENGLGEPAVWQSQGRWWMLYTGRDRREHRRLGLAFSRDGARWQRFDGGAAVLAGSEPWNAKVVCDPTVMQDAGGRLRVWFGGGDVAHPAENIHGRIGYAELVLAPQ